MLPCKDNSWIHRWRTLGRSKPEIPMEGCEAMGGDRMDLGVHVMAMKRAQPGDVIVTDEKGLPGK